MEIVLLRGIPGSGKTTYAKKLTANTLASESCVCCADDYHVVDGKYVFNQDNANNAHLNCYAKFVAAIDAKKNLVIVTNTNTNLFELAPYVQYARINLDKGDTLRIVRCDCTVETSIKRNIHNVPEVVIKNMNKKMQKLLAWWPKEEVVDTN